MRNQYRYSMRNHASKRTSTKILPLNASMNGRDVLCLVIAAIAIVCMLWGTKTRSTLMRELRELKDMALMGEGTTQETRLNLFSTPVIMRDGSNNEILKRAINELANLVIDKYIEVRPGLIDTMVDKGQFEWDPTHSYVRAPKNRIDFMYAKNFGMDINNAFLAWQRDRGKYAEEQFQNCIKERRTDVYDIVCQKHLVEDEWPQVYTSKAYKIVADYILSTCIQTTAVCADYSKELQARLSEGEPLVRGGLDDVWFSVHTPGVFHDEHNHDNSGLAGTFYLKASNDSGKIVWVDPRYPHSRTESLWSPREGFPGLFVEENGKPVNVEVYLFDNSKRGIAATPREGMLFLFPPWVYHQVSPTMSPDADAERAKSSPADSDVDDTARTPLWQSVGNRSQFRVAMSFNIGDSWKASVDFSSIDVFDPSAARLLRQGIISPTSADNITWMYEEDVALRTAMLKSLH